MFRFPEGYLSGIEVEDWKRKFEGLKARRALIFTCSVDHARLTSNILNRVSAGFANYVHGKTDEFERPKIIEDFANGRILALANCGVFLEGFDDPGVEVISNAKPTKSRALYAQSVGRGFRPHSSIADKLNFCPVAALRRSLISRSPKPICTVLDFVGNSGRHKLMSTANILGGNVSDEAIQAAVAIARKSGKPVRMDKSLEEEEKRLEEKRKKELEEQSRKAKLVLKASYKSQKIDPFDILDLKPSKPRGWDSAKVISEKMANFLRSRMEIDPYSLTYTQAKQLIGEQMRRYDQGLCNLKQAKWLKSHGYPSDTKFDTAKQIMNSWKNNGWHRPAEIKPIVKIPVRRNENPF